MAAMQSKQASSGLDVQLELDPERGKAMEVAGFVGWLSTTAVLLLYFFWAFTPDAHLQAMGIHYYPNRYLAVAVPAWGIVTFLCWSLAVTGANLYSTAPPESYESLQDTASNELPDRTDWGSASAMGTPELADYPVTLVTRALYAVPRDRNVTAAARPPVSAVTGTRDAAGGAAAGGQMSSFGDFSGLAAPVSPLGGGQSGGDAGWGGGELGMSTTDFTAHGVDDGGAVRVSSRDGRRGGDGTRGDVRRRHPVVEVEPSSDG